MLGLAIILMFSGGCSREIDDASFIFSSPEKKLARTWKIQSLSKDGTPIYTPICGMSSHIEDYPLFFYNNGAIKQTCSYLNPLYYRYVLGTWELTDHRKNIKIILTDSLYINNNTIVQIARTEINWKILKLTVKTLQVQETRSDGIYEFTFKPYYKSS